MHMFQTKQLQLRFVSGTQIQWNEQKTKKFAHYWILLSDSLLRLASVNSADIFKCSALYQRLFGPKSICTCLHMLQTKQLIQHLCLQKLVIRAIDGANFFQSPVTGCEQYEWVKIVIDIKRRGAHHINTTQSNIFYQNLQILKSCWGLWTLWHYFLRFLDFLFFWFMVVLFSYILNAHRALFLVYESIDILLPESWLPLFQQQGTIWRWRWIIGDAKLTKYITVERIHYVTIIYKWMRMKLSVRNI